MSTNPRTTFDQLIERIAYPTDTHAVIAFMRQHGKGDDVVDLATTLPNRTFNSPHEIRTTLDS